MATKKQKTNSRSVGLSIPMPKQECKDSNCPFHGNISLRGRQLTGTVTSTKMRKTAVIELKRLNFVEKYERYEKRMTKLKVHNPECINAKEGEIVRVVECRPLSKTKNFMIVEKLGMEKGFIGKMEARESAKIEKPKKEAEEVKQNAAS